MKIFTGFLIADFPHIPREITNLTLKILHQRTATTLTPTTAVPHREIKGL